MIKSLTQQRSQINYTEYLTSEVIQCIFYRMRMFYCLLLVSSLLGSTLLSEVFVVCVTEGEGVRIEPFHRPHCCGEAHGDMETDCISSQPCTPCNDESITMDSHLVNKQEIHQLQSSSRMAVLKNLISDQKHRANSYSIYHTYTSHSPPDIRTVLRI